MSVLLSRKVSRIILCIIATIILGVCIWVEKAWIQILVIYALVLLGSLIIIVVEEYYTSDEYREGDDNDQVR